MVQKQEVQNKQGQDKSGQKLRKEREALVAWQALAEYREEMLGAYWSADRKLRQIASQCGQETRPQVLRCHDQLAAIIGGVLLGRYTKRELQYIFDDFPVPQSEEIRKLQESLLIYAELDHKRHMAVTHCD